MAGACFTGAVGRGSESMHEAMTDHNTRRHGFHCKVSQHQIGVVRLSFRESSLNSPNALQDHRDCRLPV